MRHTIGAATLYTGDCIEVLRSLLDQSVNCCVTSPPYFGLRDYGHDGQIGLEPTPDEYVAKLVEVFREVRRVLADDGTLWLNLGDSYASGGRKTRDPGQSKLHPAFTGEANATTNFRPDDGDAKPKDLLGMPWRVAFALQADGWYLRQDIIWHKPNPMPESVKDRCTKAHEYIFLLSKSARYYFDQDAITEAGNPNNHRVANCSRRANTDGKLSTNRADISCETRNRRSVWTVATQSYSGAHFATFPPALIEPCVMAGCPAGGTVLDPFSGSGTTGQVALQQGRKYLGIELNPEYQALAIERITPHAAQERLF